MSGHPGNEVEGGGTGGIDVDTCEGDRAAAAAGLVVARVCNMSRTCSGVSEATSAARDVAETPLGRGPRADSNDAVAARSGRVAIAGGGAAISGIAVDDDGRDSADAGGGASLPLFRTQMPIM